MKYNDQEILEAQRESFANLLDQCLRVDASKDELLIIYDESFLPYFDGLQNEIVERGISNTSIFMPFKYQKHLIESARRYRDFDSIQLPKCMGQAIFSATAILNLLNGEQETVLVRASVLQQGRAIDCRLAHIPGIDIQILNILSISPFPEIKRSAELLAWALGEAREALLVSYDTTGKEYHLRMDLEGWDNEPIMSSGVIDPGGWGNVPPGETYCCPDPFRVSGAICINGSVPGHVFSNNEQIILTFEQGKLKNWDGDSSLPSYTFFDKERDKALLRHDDNWNTIAELGIGLNPAIKILTGNSLFDEKALKTIHIAIGSNISFGHHIRSAIHADLVTWNPSLWLDSRLVMDRGTLKLDEIESRRNSKQKEEANFRPGVKIFLREGRVAEQEGLLKRVLIKADRVGFVLMAGNETSRRLAHVARELEKYGDITLSDFINRHPKFDEVSTQELLGLLDHYLVLGFSGVGAAT